MAATINLSSLELALVAELNLEMARAYDEVAEDAAGGLRRGGLREGLDPGSESGHGCFNSRLGADAPNRQSPARS